MTKSKHTDHLGIPTFAIVFANVVDIRRIMQSETSCHDFYGQFLGGSFRAGMRGGVMAGSLDCLETLETFCLSCLFTPERNRECIRPFKFGFSLLAYG